MITQPGEQPVNDRRRHERPRGIVDQHAADSGGRERFEAVADRLLAGRSADDRRRLIDAIAV